MFKLFEFLEIKRFWSFQWAKQQLEAPRGLKSAKDTLIDKMPTTCFEWDGSVENKVKNVISVFVKGSTEIFFKWRDTIDSLQPQS